MYMYSICICIVYVFRNCGPFGVTSCSAGSSSHAFLFAALFFVVFYLVDSFPPFYTCPVVLSYHSWTIGNICLKLVVVGRLPSPSLQSCLGDVLNCNRTGVHWIHVLTDIPVHLPNCESIYPSIHISCCEITTVDTSCTKIC